MSEPEFRIEPWAKDDLPLLHRLLGDPAMTEYLGGPESAEKIEERHARYLRDSSEANMCRVVDSSTGESVGSVGYWERESHEGKVWETGWMVLPEHQGRGIATVATRQVIELCRAARKHQYLYAYPSVDNAPSNAICRKLGFEIVDVEDFEYPPRSGNILRCNNWRLDLFAA